MKINKPYSAVTLALIAISALVALISQLGSSQAALNWLFISDPAHAGFQDILSGQVWRLITPIFIHFGLLHFIFNMMWVWDLGKLIDARKGSGFYLLFVLLAGVLSNIAQYLLGNSPFFGGMSGVVYGLFGYVWIRRRSDASFALGLHKTTVNMMLAWFVLCWTGLLGPIANWAHTVGLLAGALWAFLENRTIDPIHFSQAENALKEQRLVHLSTADMLQIEEQKQWVRDNAPADLRIQYDSVAGKLAIVNAIVKQHPAVPFELRQQRSLDIAFADALVQATGAQWAILEDGGSRTLVLILPAGPLTIFPMVPVCRIMSNDAAINLQQIFDNAVRTIMRQQ